MLHIHQSNDLHRLTDALNRQLLQQPADALHSEIVLVQNPGMKRWLQQSISRQQGIAANLHFPLPSRFIWDIFLTQFDDVQNLSGYDGEVLRWYLLDLLRQWQEDPKLSLLKPYLEDDRSGVAALQLAEKLASLFDQYLVYRPQMIQRWEQGGAEKWLHEAWQAALWRQLRQRNPQPHRADLIQRLIGHLQSGNIRQQQLPRQVFVFAVSAMSPLYLNVLAALGQHIDIHLFNHNPCAHYWGDLQSRREKLQNPGDSEVVENDVNELLASLGRQGRDYIDQFYQLGYKFQEHDDFIDIEGTSVLAQIQRDILMLEPDTEPATVEDNSTQIVSCYSELRELQVLHDRLLDQLQQDPTLQPHDIVVMCPDINRLAPFIQAVFGQQPAHKRIPFSISDHNQAAHAPLIQAVLDWIQLSNSRLGVSELLGWLELPALQRACQLDSQDIEQIRYWIKSTHIHWAVDARHKSRLGFAESILNTWQHGINRLLARYCMNDQVEMLGQVPTSEAMPGQNDVMILGRLQSLLDDLLHWSRQFSQAMTLTQWQQQINQMLDSLIEPDEEEEWQLKPLRDELSGWQVQSQAAGFDQPLSADAVHYWLQQGLQQGSAQHHYLGGGINFCNLIPMRTLPFKVVCLIGMGDEYFPRNQAPLQFDLISQHPQKGDRSSREDDRYMFLQSLVSAGQLFYISYVGRNRRDDSTLEPSVVVSELLDYIEHRFGTRPDIEQTALQAFSEKNFAAGSYAEQWYAPERTGRAIAFDQALPQQTTEDRDRLTLKSLIGFFRNPPRYFMKNRLNLSLDEYEEIPEDDEPFTLSPLQRYQVNHQLLRDFSHDRNIDPSDYLVTGELPEPPVGQIELSALTDKVKQLYQQMQLHPDFSGLMCFESRLELSHQLSGEIESYSGNGLLQLSLSKPRGKHLIECWIQHLVWNATEPGRPATLIYPDNSNSKSIHWRELTVEEARSHLQNLLDLFESGQNRMLHFYPDTAYEYLQKKNKSDEWSARQHIQQLWLGDNYSAFYEAEDVYLNTGLKNGDYKDDIFPPEFYQNAEQILKPMIEAMQHD